MKTCVMLIAACVLSPLVGCQPSAPEVTAEKMELSYDVEESPMSEEQELFDEGPAEENFVILVQLTCAAGHLLTQIDPDIICVRRPEETLP